MPEANLDTLPPIPGIDSAPSRPNAPMPVPQMVPQYAPNVGFAPQAGNDMVQGYPDPNATQGYNQGFQFSNDPMSLRIPDRAPDGIPMFENIAVRDINGNISLVEFVNIKTPGDNKSMPCRKVTDHLRMKYRPWYEAWRRGLEMSPSGIPLEAWPVMDTGTVQACKALNIFSVEQLSETADQNLHRLPMGRTLKNRAIEWLKNKGDADAIDQLARQKDELLAGQNMLEDQNRQLSEKLNVATELTNRMTQRLDALEAAKAAGDNIIDRPISPTFTPPQNSPPPYAAPKKTKQSSVAEDLAEEMKE